MKIKTKGKEFVNVKIIAIICWALYYSIGIYLPKSTNRFLGKFSKAFRYICVKHIFKKCGKNVNVEKGADFGFGINVEIGDYSGIGVDCSLPSNIKIGNYVMMGPNCHILNQNHKFENIDIPMMFQGYIYKNPCVIEDDVWIGRDVLITPGQIIRKGSVIAGGCVLCKSFPEYSIIGGNPSRLIGSRI